MGAPSPPPAAWWWYSLSKLGSCSCSLHLCTQGLYTTIRCSMAGTVHTTSVHPGIRGGVDTEGRMHGSVGVVQVTHVGGRLGRQPQFNAGCPRAAPGTQVQSSSPGVWHNHMSAVLLPMQRTMIVHCAHPHHNSCMHLNNSCMVVLSSEVAMVSHALQRSTLLLGAWQQAPPLLRCHVVQLGGCLKHPLSVSHVFRWVMSTTQQQGACRVLAPSPSLRAGPHNSMHTCSWIDAESFHNC